MLINNRQRHWGALIVLVIGILLRFIYLDADPHYYAWDGYIVDEGRWNESARNLFYYHSIFIYGASGTLHLMIAPLFQFTNYLFYLLFDLNHLTSRLFPAICGSSILILFYLRLRFKVTPQALLLGITLLASQADLVMMSRVSIPEIVIMLFQLIVFFTIITTKFSPYNMIAAGFLLLIGIGMKVTMLPFVVISSVIILIMSPASLDTKGITRKLKELGLFWSGFTIPVFLIGASILFYDYFFCDLSYLHSIYHSALSVKRFIRVSSFYGFVSFPFEHILSATYNIWALGLWITVLSWTGTNKNDDIKGRYNRILVASFTWVIIYFLMMQSLSYFPGRYKIHILIPMAVIITAGISLFQQVGVIKVVESFTKGKSRSQVFRIFILSFPTSVFISPLIIYLLTQAFTNSDRLLYKIACIILLSFVITTLLYIIRFNKKIICFFLVFPIVVGACWQLLWAFSAGRYHFWINSESLLHPVVWTFTLLITLITSVVLVCVIYKLSHVFLRRVIIIVSIFCLTISFVRISPCYLSPQYTIKDTSEKIGTLLAGSSSVACISASSLFIGNSIPYRWFGSGIAQNDFPEFIVKAFNRPKVFDIILRKYRPIQKYKLYIAPEYVRYITAREDFFRYHLDKKFNEVVVYKRIKNEFSGKNIMR